MASGRVHVPGPFWVCTGPVRYVRQPADVQTERVGYQRVDQPWYWVRSGPSTVTLWLYPHHASKVP